MTDIPPQLQPNERQEWLDKIEKANRIIYFVTVVVVDGSG
jgi:hypothetical protein